ncbi:hypothetical protein GCK32_017505 [Trichostrongylus colubriformis]|uniref:Nucleotide-diphospho-sugar transferase domain-containing protein n=1 Tax=Trichostrongylus colubriformis TaxID=6319 RepID=A0AAN8EZA5_TRICO
MGTELRCRDGAGAVSGTASPSSSSIHESSKPRNHRLSRTEKMILRVPVILFYAFWFLFGVLVLRKTQNAIAAVRYVKRHGHTVAQEIIENSREFEDLIHVLDEEFTRPPAFLLLNQYALNMTYNFLCNTASLPGVHERLIFVTLDTVARDELRRTWPGIRIFHWPTPSLYKPFSFAEGPYQTIYLLRANLAVSLLRRGKSFWMMQQDTFWRKNLFEVGFEDDMSYDAIFDQLGVNEKSMRTNWVNGEFFRMKSVSDLDGGSKLMQLGKFGFHFVDKNGTCDHSKVQQARERMETGEVEVRRNFPSWGRLQFKAYWYIVDYILWTPYIGPLLKPYLPLVGYILMITL